LTTATEPKPDRAPPPGPGAASGRRFGAGRYLAALAALGGFVFLGWWAPPFRHFLGIVGDYIPLVAYPVVLLVLISRVVLRRSRDGLPDLPERWRVWITPAGLSASVAAFCVPAFSAWDTGRGMGAVLGAVPFGDSQMYLGGAERLLFFGSLDDWSSRRPLDATFLAARLAVSGLDLRIALILQAALLGAACFLAARVVARRLGLGAGLALFAGLYVFGYGFAQSALSESLGITLGALAFAALWRAVERRSVGLAIAGTFVLMLALDAREATPLLPVVLAVWFAWFFRAPRRRLNLAVLTLGLAAVVLGFAMNYAAVAVSDGNASAVAGNSGYLIYGMAKGIPGWDATQVSWSQVLVDHPRELSNISDARRDQLVSKFARDELAAHPVRFAKAVVKSGLNYGRLVRASAFQSIKSGAVRDVLAVLAVLGIAVLLALRRRPWRAAMTDLAFAAALALMIPALAVLVLRPQWGAHPLLLASGLLLVVTGVVAFGWFGVSRLKLGPLSSFALVSLGALAFQIPFIGTDTVRVLAALAPFVALPFAVACGAIDGSADADAGDDQTRAARWPDWVPASIGVAILAAALLGAPLAAAVVQRPSTRTVGCADGSAAQPFFGGVAVEVTNRSAVHRALDQVSAAALQDVPTYLDQYFTIRGPTTVIAALDAHGNDRTIFVPGNVDAPRTGVLYLCGAARPDPVATAWSALAWPFPITFGYFAGRPVSK